MADVAETKGLPPIAPKMPSCQSPKETVSAKQSLASPAGWRRWSDSARRVSADEGDSFKKFLNGEFPAIRSSPMSSSPARMDLSHHVINMFNTPMKSIYAPQGDEPGTTTASPGGGEFTPPTHTLSGSTLMDQQRVRRSLPESVQASPLLFSHEEWTSPKGSSSQPVPTMGEALQWQSFSQHRAGGSAQEWLDKLVSDDPHVAMIIAKALSDYCDVFCVGVEKVEEHRSKAGQLPGLWDNFALLIASDKCQPKSDAVLWAMQAVGLIAFQIDHNTAAIAEHTELLLAIAGVMENGSEAEQIAACGAICNVCASGNVSEKFAKCEPLVRAILKLSRAGGDVRLRAVGCFTNMSNGANPHEVLMRYDGIIESLESIVNLKGEGNSHEVLLARATMALANMTGANEASPIVAKPEVIDTINKCCSCAVAQLSGGLGSCTYGTVIWTVSIVLYPIYQLSIADANKKSLVEAGVIKNLLQIIMLWDSEECTINVEWALLTLRQLCFDKDCKARIIAEMPATQLVQSYTPEGAIAEAGTALDTLNRIIELDPPSVLERTRDTGATLGILASNLKDQVYIVHTVDNVVAASREDADNKWVMISYNWDVQDQAKELCSKLHQVGVVVWMDILDGCMAGDTLEAMANAVGRAAVVLILVTYKYKESANCRREASYANDLKKNIIPVILEPDYVPNATWGWLGLVIAGKKAFNYCRSNPKRDEELQQLISLPILENAPRVPPVKSTIRALANASVVLKDNERRVRARADSMYVHSGADRSLLEYGQGSVSPVRSLSNAAIAGRMFNSGEFTRSRSQQSYEDSSALSSRSVESEESQRRAGTQAAYSFVRSASTDSVNMRGDERSSSQPLDILASSRSISRGRRVTLTRRAADGAQHQTPPPSPKTYSTDESGVGSVRSSATSHHGHVLLEPPVGKGFLRDALSSSRASSLVAGRGHHGIKMTSKMSLVNEGGSFDSEGSITGVTIKNATPGEDLASDAELRQWLSGLDPELEQYHGIFVKHRMTIGLISFMTDRDLETEIEPHIPVLGHRLLLRRQVARLRESTVATASVYSGTWSFPTTPRSPAVLRLPRPMSSATLGGGFFSRTRSYDAATGKSPFPTTASLFTRTGSYVAPGPEGGGGGGGRRQQGAGGLAAWSSSGPQSLKGVVLGKRLASAGSSESSSHPPIKDVLHPVKIAGFISNMSPDFYRHASSTSVSHDGHCVPRERSKCVIM